MNIFKIQTQQIKNDNQHQNLPKFIPTSQKSIKTSSQSIKNIIINYSQKDLLIYNLFKNIEQYHNGFYVDIGLTHPYFQSKTHQLFVKGWKGVQLDYKYQTVNKFYYLRPQTITLNMAVNDKNHYLDFYNISTTSLKNLCQRYYSKNPTLMTITLDQLHQTVQNLQYSLESNNWSSQKCRPQVLMIQHLGKNQFFKQKSYEKVLQKSQYEKFFQDNSSVIWIQSKKVQNYKQISQKNQQQLSKTSKKINYIDLIKKINKKFNQFYEKGSDFNDLQNYDPLNSSFYIHFSKPKVPILIQKLNLLSKQAQITQQLSRINRPILILQYNSSNTDLIISSDSYSLFNFYLKYDQNLTLHFWELRMVNMSQNKKNERNYQVFILDHQYQQSQQNLQNKLNFFVKSQQNKQSKKYLQTQLFFKILFVVLLISLLITLRLKKKKQEAMNNRDIAMSKTSLDEVQLK